MLTTQKSLLIVEDEESLLNILATTLSREGYKVHTARNGEIGLAAARKFHPDLIIVDILMPVMDGITLLKKLWIEEWGRDIPAIILTNLHDTETLIEAVEFDTLRVKSARGKEEYAFSNVGVVRESIKTYLSVRVNQGICEFLVKKNIALKDVINRVKAVLNLQDETKHRTHIGENVTAAKEKIASH